MGLFDKLKERLAPSTPPQAYAPAAVRREATG